MKAKPILNKRNFNLKNFWTWLHSQPDERSFHYYNVRGCLFASFAKEFFRLPKGVYGVSMGGLSVSLLSESMSFLREIIPSKEFTKFISQDAVPVESDIILVSKVKTLDKRRKI